MLFFSLIYVVIFFVCRFFFINLCAHSFSDQPSVRELFERIIGLLEADRERQLEMKESQQLHGSLLHTILKQLNGANGVVASSGQLPDGAVLPLASMEDFRRLEERIAVDDEFGEALVSSNELTD